MNTINQKLQGGQLVVWLASEYHPINFALTARIRGDFTPEQFQQALGQLRRKYPPLSTRAVRKPDGIYVVSDPTLTFPVRAVARQNTASWVTEASAELALPFDLFNQPPLRLVLLQGEDVTELLFVCPHAFADGLSVAYLIRDFLVFLNEPDAPATPAPPVPSLSASIPEFPGKRMAILRAKLTAGLFKLFLKRGAKRNTSADAAKFTLHPWTLSAEHTAALVARSRAEGATVHAALCAAFLRAFGEFHGDGWKRRIQSPVNLRERLKPPAGEAFGLFVNLVELLVNCSPQRDFWEVARHIKRGFTRRADDRHIFNTLIEANVAMEVLHDSITPQVVAESFMAAHHDLSISNLGRLDFPLRYGALRLEALFGPILGGDPEDIVLGVTTIGDKMHFSLSFTDLKLTSSQAEQIIETAMKRLAEAANW